MNNNAERAIAHYAQAYTQLYNRAPRDLRALDSEWVLVNGAQMHVGDLQYLTDQLRRDYERAAEQKKTLLTRLIKWFKQ